MGWLELVAVGLAGWRLAAMLSYEAGPMEIFRRLRSRLGMTHDGMGVPASWPNTLPATLLSCPWCLSPWTCAAMWAVWQWRPEPVAVLAAAAIAVAVERWCHG